ncbi:MAG: phosphonate ABC transporter, permease protein PhnE, partial [Paracoccus sp. (in: a-proteobacteria)]|nr:phosphonate ABC transporter, permease protein PhnE [Paracoccus sp. (in: a-proteobacteria)]
EINVRGAAIVGIVGAGGIGQELMGAVRMFAMTEVSAIVILIMVLVSVIDMTCEKLRLRIVGTRG